MRGGVQARGRVRYNVKLGDHVAGAHWFLQGALLLIVGAGCVAPLNCTVTPRACLLQEGSDAHHETGEAVDGRVDVRRQHDGTREVRL